MAKNKNTPATAEAEEVEVVAEPVEETEVAEEAVAEKEIVDEVEEVVASASTNKFGVYLNGRLVTVVNSVNHGKDYKKIAQAMADRLQEKQPEAVVVAKAYEDPKEPEPEKDLIKIVNGSNSLVREFSRTNHGKDYAKLATDFLAKYGVKRGYRIG